MKKPLLLKILATNWGFNGTMDQFCAAAKKEGYDGIETDWPAEESARELLFAALQKYSLEVGFLCEGWQQDAAWHLDDFTKNLQAATRNTRQRPLYINCHSGRDYFTPEEGLKFIDAGIQAFKETGIPVYHETHRGRLMYSAPVTRYYLEKRPGLLLNADLSHWCNVHESLMGGQEETMELVLARTGHIHARIGHPEGPQVNDPRAPEWKDIVEKHFQWWDRIIEHKLNRGENLITILTEFGPPPYLPTKPYTQQPLSNQWEINVYMMKLLRERYGN